MKTKRDKKPPASQPNRKNQHSAASVEILSAGRVIFVICLLSFLAYSNSLGGDFVFDDKEQIVDNRDLRSWDNLSKAFSSHVWAFRDAAAGTDAPPPLPYYRPLFTVMLTIEYQAFGLWPAGWHLVSLLLHILCSVGVYYALLLMSGRKTASALAAMLFAVHPVHTESVAWISGMTDPLFGAFFLASLCWYLKSRSENTASKKSLIGSLSLFVAAAFSKETALSLVILIFAYELIENEGAFVRRVTRAARCALPYLVASFLYLIPRYLVLGELMFKNPQAPDRPFSYTLLSLPMVVMSYLWHLIWPVGLSVTYDTHFVTSPGSMKFLLPALGLAALPALLWAMRARVSREVWKSLLLIFVTLLPVLNLGQISQEEYLVFDHYLYLSVAGWTYLLALAVESLIKSRQPQKVRAGYVAAVVLLIASAAIAAFENRSWADSFAVWSNASAVRPGYWAPQYNAGLALLDRERYDESLVYLEGAAQLKPDEARVFDALGRAHKGKGDARQAKENFTRALALDPGLIESLNNLGTVYFDEGDFSTAEKYFKEALRINPEAQAVRFNLSKCYLRQGRTAEAIESFERYLRSSPQDAEAYYELGLSYERAGKRAEAVSSFQRGITLARLQELKDKIAESLSRIQREGK